MRGKHLSAIIRSLQYVVRTISKEMMSKRSASLLAWSMCALSLALTALGLLLLVLNHSHPDVDVFEYWLENTLGALTFSTLGALIASRRSKNLIGWLFCAFGLGAGIAHSGGEYAIYALVAEPGSLPGGQWVAWVSSLTLFLTVGVALTFMFLLFPDGQLPTPRWRLFALFTGCDIVLAIFLTAITPGPLQEPFQFASNPVGVVRGDPAVYAVAGVATLFLFVAAVCSLISVGLRFRRSSAQQRQQIKWFAYAGAASLFTLFVVPRVLEYAFGQSAWANALDSVTVAVAFDVGIPASIGVAILKHRLYEIDIIINRTLVYGFLTAVLALLYFSSVTLLQYLLSLFAGQGNTLAIVASTLAIAALFNPLRRRIQGFVDRRFYRRKYDATKTLATFNAKLRDETDLNSLGEDLLTVVSETMQPAHVSLWLRSEVASSTTKEQDQQDQ